MKIIIGCKKLETCLSIKQIIEEGYTEFEFCALTDNAKALYHEIIEKSPEMVLIEPEIMDDELFNLFKDKENRKYGIIFLDEGHYTRKAWELDARTCSIVPFNLREFDSEYTYMLVFSILKSDSQEELEIEKNKSESKIIYLPVANGIEPAIKDEIILIRSERVHTSVVLKNRIISTSRRLKDLLPELGSNFIRIHRSYAINLNHAKEIITIKGKYCIKLSNGEEALLAKRNKHMIDELYLKIGNNLHITHK